MKNKAIAVVTALTLLILTQTPNYGRNAWMV